MKKLLRKFRAYHWLITWGVVSLGLNVYNMYYNGADFRSEPIVFIFWGLSDYFSNKIIKSQREFISYLSVEIKDMHKHVKTLINLKRGNS